ncbi:extracellular solute-binding protein [Chloroflexota bacterium]
MWVLKRLPLAFTGGLVFGLSIILLAACDLPAPKPTSAVGTPTDTPPAVSGEPVAGEATPEPGEVTPQPPAFVTVTVWTTELFSPTQALTRGKILAQNAARFTADNRNVRLQFIPKKAYGDGGILDFLQTTGDVVPNLLPEVVFIDVDELGPAVDAGLVQPLDDLVPSDVVDDLYPFAREACTIDGQLYCLQFQADLDHLAYDTGRVVVPPGSWPEVLSYPGQYTFPAGGQDDLVDDDTLIQYMDVRSWPIDDDSGEPFLEQDSLVAVLQYYHDGRAREVFPAKILEYRSFEENPEEGAEKMWRDFLAGESAMTHVSASRYLSERGSTPQGPGAAAIPAISGPVAALGRGWAMALVTTDPFREDAAVEFMTQLMAPETNAGWNQAAGYLPTRQTAITYWHPEDDYTPFIHQRLLTARRRPRLPSYAQLAAVFQVAVESVLSGTATPEEAAAQAIEDAP